MTWQPKKLNDLCEILIGGTPSRGVVEYWKNGTLPWVSIRDMSREGDLIENTNEKITEKGAKESNVKLIPKGSLLFSFKLSIGKLALAGSDLYTNEAIAALVIKDEKQLDKNFLRYYMSQMVFDDVTTAVKGSTLNKEKIKNLEIPLPPLATQRQIVAILDEKFAKLREAKRLREEAIEDTEKILATTLREIFNEGKERGWEESTLGEIAEVVGGGTPSTAVGSYWDDTYAWATPKDLGKLDGMYIEKTEKTISEMGLKNSSAKLLPIGSIVFSSRAPIGYLAINTVPMATNQGCRNFVCTEKMINKFLYYSLIHNRDHIKSLGSGSTFAEISGSKLKEVQILVPPLAEQKEIVTRLDALSEKLRTLRELQQSQLDDMKKLEKAYLREAFCGELC
jgi:type I restriction enzyme S subunit